MQDFEKVKVAQNDILVVKCECAQNTAQMACVRENIEEQLKSGVVMIPFGYSWGVVRRDSAFVTLEGKP